MYLVCCDEKLLCEKDLLDFLLEDNVDKGWSHTTAKLWNLKMIFKCHDYVLLLAINISYTYFWIKFRNANQSTLIQLGLSYAFQISGFLKQ